MENRRGRVKNRRHEVFRYHEPRRKLKFAVIMGRSGPLRTTRTVFKPPFFAFFCNEGCERAARQPPAWASQPTASAALSLTSETDVRAWNKLRRIRWARAAKPRKTWLFPRRSLDFGRADLGGACRDLGRCSATGLLRDCSLGSIPRRLARGSKEVSGEHCSLQTWDCRRTRVCAGAAESGCVVASVRKL